MRRRWSQWAASLAITFLLAACSGGERATESSTDSGAGRASSTPDACAVLTAEEIEQVLKIPAKVQPGDQLKSIATTSMCGYESAVDGHNLVSFLIRVGPAGLDAQTNLQQYVAGIKMNMGDSYRIDRVEGMSGPAVWNPDMKQLTAFQGRTLIIVTILGAPAPDVLEAAKALAEKALPDIR